MGNHSRPTPLTIISFLLLLLLLLFFRLVGWAAELGPGSYPDFLSFFFPTGFLGRFFSGPRLTTVSCWWLPSSRYFSSCYWRNLEDREDSV